MKFTNIHEKNELHEQEVPKFLLSLPLNENHEKANQQEASNSC